MTTGFEFNCYLLNLRLPSTEPEKFKAERNLTLKETVQETYIIYYEKRSLGESENRSVCLFHSKGKVLVRLQRKHASCSLILPANLGVIL